MQRISFRLDLGRLLGEHQDANTIDSLSFWPRIALIQAGFEYDGPAGQNLRRHIDGHWQHVRFGFGSRAENVAFIHVIAQEREESLTIAKTVAEALGNALRNLRETFQERAIYRSAAFI